MALSAIEQSLWDLQGQALGVPCYQLFGGRLRPRVRQYANINRMTTDRTPAGFARSAEQAAAAGFDALKMAPFDGMPKAAGAARSAHIALGDINEFAFGEAPWRAELIDPPEAFDAGHLSPSERPGFGIRLNDDLLRRLAL